MIYCSKINDEVKDDEKKDDVKDDMIYCNNKNVGTICKLVGDNRGLRKKSLRYYLKNKSDNIFVYKEGFKIDDNMRIYECNKIPEELNFKNIEEEIKNFPKPKGIPNPTSICFHNSIMQLFYAIPELTIFINKNIEILKGHYDNLFISTFLDIINSLYKRETPNVRQVCPLLIKNIFDYKGGIGGADDFLVSLMDHFIYNCNSENKKYLNCVKKYKKYNSIIKVVPTKTLHIYDPRKYFNVKEKIEYIYSDIMIIKKYKNSNFSSIQQQIKEELKKNNFTTIEEKINFCKNNNNINNYYFYNNKIYIEIKYNIGKIEVTEINDNYEKRKIITDFLHYKANVSEIEIQDKLRLYLPQKKRENEDIESLIIYNNMPKTNTDKTNFNIIELENEDIVPYYTISNISTKYKYIYDNNRYLFITLTIYKVGNKADERKININKTLKLDNYDYDIIGVSMVYPEVHYIAYTKIKEKWYKCNDSTISSISNFEGEKYLNINESNFLPYVLLYRKRGNYAKLPLKVDENINNYLEDLTT